MIALAVKSELGKMAKAVRNIEKQTKFATAKALTKTVADIKEDQPKVMERQLDRPTPFTKRGLYVRRATKLRLVATVGIKDIQAKYLGLQISGGVRAPKRKALVAPVGQRRNKYGNLPRGGVKKLREKPNTFSGTIDGTAGIWQRSKSGRLKLLVSYSSEQKYSKRYDFEGTARTLAAKRFPVHMRKAMSEALRTARK